MASGAAIKSNQTWQDAFHYGPTGLLNQVKGRLVVGMRVEG